MKTRRDHIVHRSRRGDRLRAGLAISAQPMEMPPVELAAGAIHLRKRLHASSPRASRTPRKLKIEMPKPLADKVDAPKAVDQLAPKVVDKPEIKTEVEPTRVKAHRAEAVRSPSQTDPKPDPKQAQKPDKPKTPEYKPDQIADLLKKDAAKNPVKPDDQSTPQKADAPKFDANQVAELLDKREPQRQLASAERSTTANLGAASGAPDAQLSQSEIDALRARINQLLEPAARHRRQLQVSMSCCRFCSSTTAPWRTHPVVVEADRRRRWGRRSPRAPSVRCCCASRSRCSSRSITISGKTSSSNSIRTNFWATDRSEFRHMTLRP